MIFMSQLLNTIVSKGTKRNKVIKIVSRSLAGRTPIAEYKDDSFVSDSDDSKKNRQAENRALAKNKNQNPL